MVRTIRRRTRILHSLRHQGTTTQPLPRINQRLPTPRAKLIVTLTFTRTSTRSILRLTKIITKNNLIHRVRITLSSMISILRSRHNPLLSILQNMRRQQYTTFNHARNNKKRRNKLSLITPSINRPSKPLNMLLNKYLVRKIGTRKLRRVSTIGHVARPKIPMSNFRGTPHDKQNSRIMTRALNLRFQADRANVITPCFGRRKRRRHLLSK